MDFAPTAWVVQTVRAYPELAVFLAIGGLRKLRYRAANWWTGF